MPIEGKVGLQGAGLAYFNSATFCALFSNRITVSGVFSQKISFFLKRLFQTYNAGEYLHMVL